MLQVAQVDEVPECVCWWDSTKQLGTSQMVFRAAVDLGEGPFQGHRKLRNRSCCTRLCVYQKGWTSTSLNTHVAENMPENVGAGETGREDRRRCMRRKDGPWNHSNVGG